MKMMHPISRLLRRLAQFFGLILQPRHALPSVGLVVLGGCLTFIITPDDPDAVSPPAPLKRNEFPLVILDPGHGGRDEGTKWRGLAERELTLDLALRVERLLKIAGFRTMLTRHDDTYVSLEERTRLANNQSGALFVSLHFNSDPTGTSSGIETYYAQEKVPIGNDWSWVGIFNKSDPLPPDSSETLAGAIQTALVSRTEAKNRGIHSKNFYVVHHTRCPSVLIESGFISNAFESQLLSTETYRDLLAQGIVEGLLRYQQTIPAETRPPAVLAEQPR
ncbi:MAG TPA: N-acetylmuramoyl-L-alanine amidase [Chthoniobacteraceae bacterium]|jgi:N-acetylmuramoyl-L-alanine amidase|nr:N-acetylmuramoyl-L-alanine amidase [Chthoniobacteraceae bacterium]